jgi:flagellar protein FlaG
MEPKAALSAIRDFIATATPASNAPDPSAGANAVSGHPVLSPDASPADRPSKAPAPVDNGPQPGDLRLVIDQDPGSGEYVYKTVDRRTGETLQQFPREEILKLRDAARYEAGKVYDGKA